MFKITINQWFIVCAANRTLDLVKTRFGVLFNEEAVRFGSLGRRGFRGLGREGHSESEVVW